MIPTSYFTGVSAPSQIGSDPNVFFFLQKMFNVPNNVSLATKNHILSKLSSFLCLSQLGDWLSFIFPSHNYSSNPPSHSHWFTCNGTKGRMEQEK
jgi:hypothetical protein